MYKNWIIICSIIVLTICSKTVNCIYCYSCGSSIYECTNKNEISKVKCGNQFTNCGNVVKFYNNGTQTVYSSFCYGQLKGDIERQCEEDSSFKEGSICKIICKHDFCNPMTKTFSSQVQHDHEHMVFDAKQSISTPNQNLENSSFTLNTNKFILLISLLFSYCVL